MTTDEVKTFLRGYLKAKERYEVEKDNLEVVETEILGLSISYGDKVQTSPVQDHLAEDMDRLSALHKKIVDCMHEKTMQMKKVYDVINQVEDATYQSVLYKKYIQDKVWEQVAVEKGYTYRRITQIHGEALLKVKEVLEKIS